MIPIIQFDPASLSLWYDTHLINRMRGSAEIGKALDYSIQAELPKLIEHVENINDDWIKTRCAAIASAVFHEKRHFLDFVLTNYGAFRLRHFFMIYCNIGALVHFAEENGEILFPIQSYLERIFVKHLGVKSPNDEVLKLARGIKLRKAMLEDDRQINESRLGMNEIGGEAILEALAHHFEVTASQLLFGEELLHKIRADVPDGELTGDRYLWLYKLLHGCGLLDLDEDTNAVRCTALVPICYAALACRLWKQEQVMTGTASSYLPGYRLASIVMALRDRRSDLKSAGIVECWNIVNATCKELFGRTCIEEIQADLDHEGSFIEQLRERDPTSLEVRAYLDFHKLRQRFFEVLKNDPAQILADLEYGLQFSTKLQPFVVVAASAGEPGEPPPDYERLLGYVDRESPKEPVRWWWAALSKNWPHHEKAEVFCLRDRAAWIDIISDAGPLAKLALDGRNIRIMLGPEILSAEMRLRHRFKTKVLIDPRFAFPRQQMTAANWYFLTGHEKYRCDLTWESVRKPEGVVIDPWTLRLWPNLLDHLAGPTADQRRVMQSFQRDWSPWLLSEEFRELFEKATDDPSLLVELNWRR